MRRNLCNHAKFVGRVLCQKSIVSVLCQYCETCQKSIALLYFPEQPEPCNVAEARAGQPHGLLQRPQGVQEGLLAGELLNILVHEIMGCFYITLIHGGVKNGI